MTDFESTIERVRPILEASGFKEVESFHNFLRLDSPKVTTIIAFDERAKCNLFGVGQINHWDFLDSKNLKEVFNYELRTNTFADFIIDFLNTGGSGLLTGETDKLIKLQKYEHEQAKIYTNTLLKQQSLTAADNEWTKGNYLAFIKSIDQIRNADLPASYRLKYKIASNRIANFKK